MTITQSDGILGFGSFNLWVGPISKVRIDVAGIPVIRRGPPVSDGWWFHRHCFGDLVEICLWDDEKLKDM